MYIRMREGRPFVFAGLWDRWNETVSFTIITTEPNRSCAKIHDRMPLILKEQDYTRWLSPSTPLDEVSSLIQPHADTEMESFAVSRIVNSPKTDTDACIRPIDPAPQATLPLVGI